MRPRPQDSCVISLPSVLALALALLPAVGSAGTDAFFDTDFDGNWVGTLDLGPTTAPVQASFEVADGTGSALLRMPDVDSGGLRLVDAELRKIKARRLILEYIDEPPADSGETPVQVTVIVRYKAAQDRLQGKVKGGLRGRILLQRTDPALPLGRLWAGTVKLGGENLDLLVQLTESEPDSTARLAANAVTGWAVLGEDEGPVRGTRSGKSVDLSVGLDAGELVADLRLARRDNQLKGTVERDGARSRVKLIPEGSNNGKPMKLRKVSPTEVQAGATTAVTLRGKNFGSGALAYSDLPTGLIGTPTLGSPRSLELDITVPADIEAGTAIGLRVVNGDGQVDERAGALTVTAADNGDPVVSFTADVAPIFANNCALVGCHNSGSAQEGLVLEFGAAFANIVNVPSSEQPSLNRITPGDPDGSYLVRKIRGDSGISGARMPLDRSPLSEEQIQTIVDWVLQGAADNGPSR